MNILGIIMAILMFGMAFWINFVTDCEKIDNKEAWIFTPVLVGMLIFSVVMAILSYQHGQ